jgi:hypothetical protein
MKAPLLAALCAGIASPAAAQDWPGLDDPSVPPPRVVEEQGEAEVFYRMPPDTVQAVARVQTGGHRRLETGGERGNGFYTMDLLGGAEIGLGRGSRWAFLPLGGYSWVARTEHLLYVAPGWTVRHLGPSIFSGDRPGSFALGVLPAVLLGRLGGERAVGVRASAFFRVWLYGIEMGYQYLTDSQRDVHELHIVFVAHMVLGEQL